MLPERSPKLSLEVELNDPTQTIPGAPAILPPPAPAPRRILIIDDTPANLGIIAEFLEPLGYEILAARSGAKGLELAATRRPDLILLDVMMPQMDGYETCRRLKAGRETEAIPVIFMTALAAVEDKVKGFSVGGIDYISKPIQLDEVRARIDTHLAAARKQRLPAAAGEMPSVLGGWRVMECIGQGGMGSVYRAEGSGRAIALKVIAQGMDDRNGRARFLREAACMAKVIHPNVVTLIGAGEDHGWLWLAMELVTGGTLHDLLEQRRRIPEAEVIRLGVQICSGLEAIHTAGLIHRDIKADNIFLAQVEGRTQVKVGDLGLSRGTAPDDRMTMTGAVCGTPPFMAPEQISGSQDLDGRIDIYAVGALLFRLLTGSKPFTGETLYTLTNNILHAPLPDMRTFTPSLSDGIIAVVTKAMHKERDRRHASARALGMHLQSLLTAHDLTVRMSKDEFSAGI